MELTISGPEVINHTQIQTQDLIHAQLSFRAQTSRVHTRPSSCLICYAELVQMCLVYYHKIAWWIPFCSLWHVCFIGVSCLYLCAYLAFSVSLECLVCTCVPTWPSLFHWSVLFVPVCLLGLLCFIGVSCLYLCAYLAFSVSLECLVCTCVPTWPSLFLPICSILSLCFVLLVCWMCSFISLFYHKKMIIFVILLSSSFLAELSTVRIESR